MSLNIKNEDTWRLAHELADLTGESLTQAVTVSVQERLERTRRRRGPRLAQRLLALGADCAARLPKSVQQADHGALLYDEKGLPR